MEPNFSYKYFPFPADALAQKAITRKLHQFERMIPKWKANTDPQLRALWVQNFSHELDLNFMIGFRPLGGPLFQRYLDIDDGSPVLPDETLNPLPYTISEEAALKLLLLSSIKAEDDEMYSVISREPTFLHMLAAIRRQVSSNMYASRYLDQKNAPNIEKTFAQPPTRLILSSSFTKSFNSG